MSINCIIFNTNDFIAAGFATKVFVQKGMCENSKKHNLNLQWWIDLLNTCSRTDEYVYYSLPRQFYNIAAVAYA